MSELKFTPLRFYSSFGISTLESAGFITTCERVIVDRLQGSDVDGVPLGSWEIKAVKSKTQLLGWQVGFCQIVADSKLTSKTPVDKASRVIDHALKDPSSWAKKQDLTPLRKKSNPESLKKFKGAPQAYFTNCMRFEIQRALDRTWEAVPTSKSGIMQLAKKGLPLHLWSEEDVYNAYLEVHAVCEKLQAGKFRTRKEMLEALKEHLVLSQQTSA